MSDEPHKRDAMIPEIKDPSTLAEREITLRRVFDAPREAVWAAWTEPEQLTRWWGPRGMTTPLDSIVVDLRTGGRFALTMVTPEGTELPHDGILLEVVPLEKIVFGGEMDDHPGLKGAETTITFIDRGDGRTEVIMHQRMTATEEMPGLAEQGWGSSFDRLEEILAG